MKYHMHKTKADGTNELCAELEKGEVFDYAAAKRLQTAEVASLLPFAYRESQPSPVLCYSTDGLVDLATFLNALLSQAQFDALLRQVALLPEQLSELGLAVGNVLFAPAQAFIDPKANSIKLAYLPVQGSLKNTDGLDDLLFFLGSKARFVNDADRSRAEQLLDFLRMQRPVSIVAFKAFLGLQALSVANVAEGAALGDAAGVGSHGWNGAAQTPLGQLLLSRKPRERKERQAPPFRDFVCDDGGAPSALDEQAAMSPAEKLEASLARHDFANKPTYSYVPGDAPLAETAFMGAGALDGGRPESPGNGAGLADAGLSGAAAAETCSSGALSEAGLPGAAVSCGACGLTEAALPEAATGFGDIGDAELPATGILNTNSAAAKSQDAWQPASGLGQQDAARLPETPAAATANARAMPIAHITHIATGRRYAIDKPQVSLGRSLSNDISFTSAINVSRRHAVLEYDGKAFILRDNHSSNGTYIGNIRLEYASKGHLASGATIALGDQEFLFEID